MDKVEAVVAINRLLGHVEAERDRSRYVSGSDAVRHLELLGYRLVRIEDEEEEK